jgi:Ni,Fe-hydrogenase III large subunit
VVVGPFYPVLEEPEQLRLFVDGEQVVGCDYRGFYNHRGIEKLGDSVLTYNQIPFVAERICGICGFIHSSCYCEAAEQAAGVPAPRRAKYIRSIMLELERIHSHLLWLGIAGHILGFDTVLMQVWRIREPIMWLCEKITGNRKTYGMNLVGGVRRDIPADLHPEILEVIGKIEAESLAVANAIQGDTTLLLRLQGVGMLPEKEARRICVVGPTARGSNVDIDARVDHPYAAYDELETRAVTHDGCDNWARVLVRVEEVFESIRLVREGLKRMPDGPIMAQFPGEIPAGRQGVRTVEAPRGEAIHYLITGENNRPERWRVRAPTYQNLQALPSMIQGETIADVPITLGSMDPCFSCTDRVETVDVRTGRQAVLTKEDLFRLSRARSGR